MSVSLVLYVIALLLLVKRVLYAQRRKDLLFLFAFIAVAAVLSLYEQADFSILLLGMLIFNGIVYSLRSGEAYAYLLIAVLFVIPVYQLSLLISQATLLGLLSCAHFFMRPNDRREPTLERKRDVVQICLGILFIGVFAILPLVYSRLFLEAMVVLALLAGNYAISNQGSGAYKLVLYFERKNAALGQGAFWLAAGSLLAVSFLGGAQAAVVLGAIFVGDAAATLVGTRYRLPLPYNKQKSAYGSAAYLLSSSLISVAFLGPVGLIISLVAALVESAKSRVDDNFDTSVALVILFGLLAYAGVA